MQENIFLIFLLIQNSLNGILKLQMQENIFLVFLLIHNSLNGLKKKFTKSQPHRVELVNNKSLTKIISSLLQTQIIPKLYKQTFKHH